MRARFSWRSDTRGAHLVEYLVLVGLVALGVLGGVRFFGAAVREKALAQADCVASLEECGTESFQGTLRAGAVSPPPPPGAEPPPPPPNAAAPRAGSPTSASSVSAPQLALARQLVRAGGSANQADVDAVIAGVARLPMPVLEHMESLGLRVVAVKNSVTDYKANLRGVHPRGWPPGVTWDSVPGSAFGREVVVATRGGVVPPPGSGHGSGDLILHETFHAIDRVETSGDWSEGRSFRRARDADAANLDAYYNQSGDAGREEAFAESAARYFAGDTAWFQTRPHLWNYWQSHDDEMDGDD